ncbi:uncharacterized protein CCR75_006068 [Bremia lactucae]|uniref:PH domain-containing protein n=1 Tax=Bremia lactucae TaxID=4779 RepID=A0A976IB84_BRELC|nr:hypothetical protein CCR75_006068 [Bremia lactucae]
MGIKKWLGLGASQSAVFGNKADDPPSHQQLQVSKSHRRHTTYDMQSCNESTNQRAQLHNRPSYKGKQEVRFLPDEKANYQLELSSEGSNVSVGVDDDYALPPALPTRSTRSKTTTAEPKKVAAQRPIGRFTWASVSGPSTILEGQNVNASVAKIHQGVVELSKHQGHRHSAHNPDTDLLPQDNGMGVVMQGWLEKCGQQFKTWNWRFFVLRKDGVLSYYTDETGKKLKGSMDIGFGSRADVSVQTNLIDRKCVFVISTSQRMLMITAPSERMMTRWMARLQAAGAVPTQPWDPLSETVKFCVRDTVSIHQWKRYDDPTSYIHMEGLLLKRGHVNKNWKNRFFRIEQGRLLYYSENQREQKGNVPLKDTIVSPGMAQCPDGRKNYFVLTSKDGKFEMHLNAHNEQSMHLWIEALQEAQMALGRLAGNKDTVTGLSLVVKRAEEIPLGKIGVRFQRSEDIDIELQKRTEALIVVSSHRYHGIAVGSQLVSIEGRSILRESCAVARQILRASSFPLQLEFLLPPYKRGELIKKSRSGFENWKRRMVVVTNGEIHYYKQVPPSTSGDKTASVQLEHRKHFSLYGCYLNLVHLPRRDLCIVVARSPSDKLVLQMRTEIERMEWASVIYCSIRMVSQGITSGHIENLQLEQQYGHTLRQSGKMV